MNKLPAVGELIKASLGIYNQYFRVFLGIQIIAFVITFLVSVLVSVIIGPTELQPVTLTDAVSRLIGGLVLGAIVLIVFLYAMGASLFVIKDQAEKIGVLEAFRRTHKIFGSLLMTVILVNIIVTLGLLLLILPGIFLGVQFFFVPYIVIWEGINGWSALKRSREYVKGYWWQVFGRNLAASALYFVVAFSISLLLTLIFGSALGAQLANVVWAILFPLYLIYVYLIYKKLREFKSAAVQS